MTLSHVSPLLPALSTFPENTIIHLHESKNQPKRIQSLGILCVPQMNRQTWKLSDMIDVENTKQWTHVFPTRQDSEYKVPVSPPQISILPNNPFPFRKSKNVDQPLYVSPNHHPIPPMCLPVPSFSSLKDCENNSPGVVWLACFSKSKMHWRWSHVRWWDLVRAEVDQ